MPKQGFILKWQGKARELRVQTLALYYAYRDPRVPWYARLFIFLVVAYAFSPIDLIPDFIPVLGYLDDLVLLPLGVALALKMIPAQVIEESRAKSRQVLETQGPRFTFVAVVIIAVWIVVLGLLGFWLYRLVMTRR